MRDLAQNEKDQAHLEADDVMGVSNGEILCLAKRRTRNAMLSS